MLIGKRGAYIEECVKRYGEPGSQNHRGTNDILERT